MKVRYLLVFAVFFLFAGESPLVAHPGKVRPYGIWKGWHLKVLGEGKARKVIEIHHHPIGEVHVGLVIPNTPENIHKCYAFATNQSWYFLSPKDVPPNWELRPSHQDVDDGTLSGEVTSEEEKQAELENDPFLQRVKYQREDNPVPDRFHHPSTIEGWIDNQTPMGRKMYLFERVAPHKFLIIGIIKKRNFVIIGGKRALLKIRIPKKNLYYTTNH